MIRDSKGRISPSHGMSRSPEYRCWINMIRRCHNEYDSSYPDYGGKGIQVCSRWRESFQFFLADMGFRTSSRHSIDRIDGSLGYSPGNCRWSTREEQQRNLASNRLVTANGVTLCVAAWAERLGVDCHVILRRLQRDWSDCKSVTTKLVHSNRHIDSGTKEQIRSARGSDREVARRFAVSHTTVSRIRRG
jgi:hypothetical protein